MSGLNLVSINVRRDTKFEHLVERLAKNNVDGHRPLFQYIKDLMVFAALVGYTNNEKKPLDSTKDTIPITLHTYSSDEKDSFIYLLALMEKEDAICLKDDNIQDSVQVFEAYCNAGLDIIDKWFLQYPGKTEIDTILEGIYAQIIRNEAANISVSSEDIEVDF